MVGMTRFELATPSPPDLYANQAALHPDMKIIIYKYKYVKTIVFINYNYLRLLLNCGKMVSW